MTNDPYIDAMIKQAASLLEEALKNLRSGKAWVSSISATSTEINTVNRHYHIEIVSDVSKTYFAKSMKVYYQKIRSLAEEILQKVPHD